MMDLLLAQASSSDKSKAFFEGLRNAVSNTYSPSSALLFWGAALIFIIFIALIARHATRRERQAIPEKPNYLTRAVDLLGLSEEDRRNLTTLAAAANLSEPASMLVTPLNFAHAVAALDATRRKQLAAPLTELSCKLFGAAIHISQS
ncbi:MAG: hypothetical protein HZB38_05700 [Planctomycetes bacterium]|nr:hypothetical protein [Planctomycetota bacterium]